jgi:hypothetical protein
MSDHISPAVRDYLMRWSEDLAFGQGSQMPSDPKRMIAMAQERMAVEAEERERADMWGVR